jgi:hypothetical protein
VGSNPETVRQALWLMDNAPPCQASPRLGGRGQQLPVRQVSC